MATASGQWEDASLLGYEDEAKPSAQNHSDSDVEMASTEEEMNLDARLDDKDAEVAADVTSDAIDIIADDDNDCSKSLGSTSSADADSDEPKEMYADLAGLKRGKITRSLTSWIRRKTSTGPTTRD